MLITIPPREARPAPSRSVSSPATNPAPKIVIDRVICDDSDIRILPKQKGKETFPNDERFEIIFLESFDPFFQKGGSGMVLPIRISGTCDNPVFGVTVFHKTFDKQFGENKHGL